MPAEARRLLGGAGGIEALAAERLVYVGLAELDKLGAGGKTVGVIGELAALDTDGVDFLHVLGDGHQERHRAEWLTEIVGVKAGDDDAHALVGKGLHHLYDAEIEELGFVDADNLDIVRNGKHLERSVDRSGGNAVVIVGDHFNVRVTVIDSWLEDGYFLMGELRPLETADEFFGLSGKHGAADDLHAAGFYVVF